MPIWEDLEKYRDIFKLHISTQELVSFLIGFTPLDAPKDIADLYAGKDIITGEEVNREILFVCLFLPEIGDQALKRFGKNSDKIISLAEKQFKTNKDVLKKEYQNAIEKSGANFDEVINNTKNEINAACFTENTLIYTKDGYTPIKDIKIGDKVYSKNVYTNEVGLKEVKNTYVKEKSKLVYITIANDIIETTEEHPFYVKNKGWVLSGNLTKDDKLVTDDEEANIEKIEIKPLDKPVKVYNFEVEDWHNYFVSENKVLVHNNCQSAEVVGKAIASAQEYATKVSNKVKVLGSYSNSSSASDILRGELKAAGIPNAPYKNAAHHIVPWNDPRAEVARDVLDQFGIEYNSAANGVFLPMEQNAYTGNAVQHIGKHSSAYIETVRDRLEEIVDNNGSKADIVSELNKIREELLNGRLKLN